MRRKKQRFLPLYSIFSIAAALLITVFVIVADKLADQNVYFYINVSGITPGKLYVTAVWLACLLFITGLNVFLHRNFRSLLLKGIILLGALLIICYFAFATLFTALFSMPRSYVSFVSDSGEHEIIIGEDNRVSAPYGGTVYERTSRFVIRKVGEYETGAYLYKPFSQGDAFVYWNETDFEIHYDYDGDGNEKTATFSYWK